MYEYTKLRIATETRRIRNTKHHMLYGYIDFLESKDLKVYWEAIESRIHQKWQMDAFPFSADIVHFSKVSLFAIMTILFQSADQRSQ